MCLAVCCPSLPAICGNPAIAAALSFVIHPSDDGPEQQFAGPLPQASHEEQQGDELKA